MIQNQKRYISIFLIILVIFAFSFHKIKNYLKHREWFEFHAYSIPEDEVGENEVYFHKQVIHVEPVFNYSFRSAPAALALQNETFKLPTYFKWKESALLKPQLQRCGDCWAFATTHTFGDRIALKTNGKVKEYLSTIDLYLCEKRTPPDWNGCKGAASEMGMEHIIMNGIATEKDVPYDHKQWMNPETKEFDPKKFGPKCKENIKRFYGGKGSLRRLCIKIRDETDPKIYETNLKKNIENMKKEIFLNGPISGGIWIYPSFERYDGTSIYTRTETSQDENVGAHAIEIVGWCDKGVNTEEIGFQDAYWICKNSWGTNWPRNIPEEHGGWFYIKMGTNECFIENRAAAFDLHVTKDLQQYIGKHNWIDNAYTSYTEYVNDPERQNFFKTLKDIKFKECNCPIGTYEVEKCNPGKRNVRCNPCYTTKCKNNETTIYTTNKDPSINQKICLNPKDPELSKYKDPCYTKADQDIPVKPTPVNPPINPPINPPLVPTNNTDTQQKTKADGKINAIITLSAFCSILVFYTLHRLRSKALT